MHKMEELRRMLVKELDEITSKGELSTGSLEVIDKLTHSIKSIDTIIAMEGRSEKRDSMGRYSRDDYSYGDYSRRGYSREELKDGLKDLHSYAKDEHSRRMIEDWMKQLDR